MVLMLYEHRFSILTLLYWSARNRPVYQPVKKGMGDALRHSYRNKNPL